MQIAGWDTWVVAVLVVCTVIVANLLAKLSTQCRRQRIGELATNLAKHDNGEVHSAQLGKTPVTIITGFLGSGVCAPR